ncbi:MAG: DUF4381 domain-containing protein [Gammaproteobacteria bacterium]
MIRSPAAQAPVPSSAPFPGPTDPADPLAALHDISLPPAVGWWPPALGWWLVLAAVILLLALAYMLWRYRHPLALRDALRHVDHLDAHTRTDAELAAALMVLLRRFAQWRYPDGDVGSAQGQAWLDWLKARAPRQCPSFSGPTGDAWLALAYGGHASTSLTRDTLLRAARRWLRHNGVRPLWPSRERMRSLLVRIRAAGPGVGDRKGDPRGGLGAATESRHG